VVKSSSRLIVSDQFDRKLEEEEGYSHWSDHSSDVDESALVPDHLKYDKPLEDDVSFPSLALFRPSLS
jgi:hypothetical protein